VIYEFACHGSYSEGEAVKDGRKPVMVADVSELPDTTLIGREYEPASSMKRMRSVTGVF
jgi:hypothetical protein